MAQVHIGSAAIRILIPTGILAVGIYVYSVLSIEPEEVRNAPAAEQTIRTRVTKLHIGKYRVIVQTNGLVQPHNQVALSAEVSGSVTVVNPAFEVGAYFFKEDVLVELDDRDHQTALRVARVQHKVAESTQRQTHSDYKRLAELFSRDAATESDLDQAAAALAQASAQLDITAAQTEQAVRDLDRTKTRAPFDGRVAQKLIGLGQLVSPGTALGVAFAVDYAEVRLPIASRELQYLKLPEMEGDPLVEVELRDAINDASDSVWKAQIIRTEGSLDEDSLELFAVAKIDDPFALRSHHPILRIGQPVIATIVGEELRDIVAIPRSAVRQLDRVFLVDEGQLTLTSRTIDAVWSDETHVIVRDASIREGALLATTQLAYAPEGGRVEIIADPQADEASAKTLVVEQ